MSGKLDHAWVVVSGEDFDATVAHFTECLKVDFGETYHREDLQLRIAFDVDAGLEIIAPLSDEGFFAELLKARGSGYWVPVFKVASIERAWEDFRKAGLPVEGEFNLLGDEPWAHRYQILRESKPDTRFGIELLIGEFQLTGDEGKG